MQRAQLGEQLTRIVIGFLLQTLHKLQASHEAKSLCLNFRRARSFAVLGVEAANPRLMKLRRFTQKPLRRERFAIGMHVLFKKDYRTSRMETPPGRRVLVAVVDGQAGLRIQAWRERHDPKQAARLPPHLTVCYRPPDAPLETLEAQVRHAFKEPVPVRLGPVFVLAHPEAPLAVGVHATADLEVARRRLFDGTHVQMGGRNEWPWHITCIRYGYKRNRETLLSLAAEELALDEAWLVDRISYLELRNGHYEALAEWGLTPTSAPTRGT